MPLTILDGSANPAPPVKPEISGDILPFDLLVETLSYLTPTDAGLAAQVCRWWQQLLARDDRLRKQVTHNAPKEPASVSHARRGHLAVLQWGVSLGWKLDAGVCEAAAEGGRLEVLQWLRASG